MDKLEKGRVAYYFRLLEHIRFKYKVGEETALALLHEVAEDLRAQAKQEGRGPVRETVEGEEPATDRQLQYLKRLGVNPKEGLSKQEASGLIDEALAEKEAEKGQSPEAAEASDVDESPEVEVIKI